MSSHYLEEGERVRTRCTASRVVSKYVDGNGSNRKRTKVEVRGVLSVTDRRVIFVPDSGCDDVEIRARHIGRFFIQQKKRMMKIQTNGGGHLSAPIFKFKRDSSSSDMEDTKKNIARLVETQAERREDRKRKRNVAARTISLATETFSNGGRHQGKKKKKREVCANDDGSAMQDRQTYENIRERAKKHLLASDDALKEQYAMMVDSGVVTREEFWRNVGTRKIEDAERLLKTNEISCTLSAEKIRETFEANPRLFAYFKEHVPHHMSEKDFWARYMVSAFMKIDGLTDSEEEEEEKEEDVGEGDRIEGNRDDATMTEAASSDVDFDGSLQTIL
eukprot:g2639.t1